MAIKFLLIGIIILVIVVLLLIFYRYKKNDARKGLSSGPPIDVSFLDNINYEYELTSNISSLTTIPDSSNIVFPKRNAYDQDYISSFNPSYTSSNKYIMSFTFNTSCRLKKIRIYSGGLTGDDWTEVEVIKKVSGRDVSAGVFTNKIIKDENYSYAKYNVIDIDNDLIRGKELFKNTQNCTLKFTSSTALSIREIVFLGYIRYIPKPDELNGYKISPLMSSIPQNLVSLYNFKYDDPVTYSQLKQYEENDADIGKKIIKLVVPFDKIYSFYKILIYYNLKDVSGCSIFRVNGYNNNQLQNNFFKECPVIKNTSFVDEIIYYPITDNKLVLSFIEPNENLSISNIDFYGFNVELSYYDQLIITNVKQDTLSLSEIEVFDQNFNNILPDYVNEGKAAVVELPTKTELISRIEITKDINETESFIPSEDYVATYEPEIIIARSKPATYYSDPRIGFYPVDLSNNYLYLPPYFGSIKKITITAYHHVRDFNAGVALDLSGYYSMWDNSVPYKLLDIFDVSNTQIGDFSLIKWDFKVCCKNKALGFDTSVWPPKADPESWMQAWYDHCSSGVGSYYDFYGTLPYIYPCVEPNHVYYDVTRDYTNIFKNINIKNYPIRFTNTRINRHLPQRFTKLIIKMEYYIDYRYFLKINEIKINYWNNNSIASLPKRDPVTNNKNYTIISNSTKAFSPNNLTLYGFERINDIYYKSNSLPYTFVTINVEFSPTYVSALDIKFNKTMTVNIIAKFYDFNPDDKEKSNVIFTQNDTINVSNGSIKRYTLANNDKFIKRVEIKIRNTTSADQIEIKNIKVYNKYNMIAENMLRITADSYSFDGSIDNLSDGNLNTYWRNEFSPVKLFILFNNPISFSSIEIFDSEEPFFRINTLGTNITLFNYLGKKEESYQINEKKDFYGLSSNKYLYNPSNVLNLYDKKLNTYSITYPEFYTYKKQSIDSSLNYVDRPVILIIFNKPVLLTGFRLHNLKSMFLKPNGQIQGDNNIYGTYITAILNSKWSKPELKTPFKCVTSIANGNGNAGGILNKALAFRINNNGKSECFSKNGNTCNKYNDIETCEEEIFIAGLSRNKECGTGIDYQDDCLYYQKNIKQNTRCLNVYDDKYIKVFNDISNNSIGCQQNNNLCKEYESKNSCDNDDKFNFEFKSNIFYNFYPLVLNNFQNISTGTLSRSQIIAYDIMSSRQFFSTEINSIILNYTINLDMPYAEYFTTRKLTVGFELTAYDGTTKKVNIFENKSIPELVNGYSGSINFDPSVFPRILLTASNLRVDVTETRTNDFGDVTNINITNVFFNINYKIAYNTDYNRSYLLNCTTEQLNNPDHWCGKSSKDFLKNPYNNLYRVFEISGNVFPRYCHLNKLVSHRGCLWSYPYYGILGDENNPNKTYEFYSANIDHIPLDLSGNILSSSTGNLNCEEVANIIASNKDLTVRKVDYENRRVVFSKPCN
jgi:hypothetical protein